jgi:hypothetical protein
MNKAEKVNMDLGFEWSCSTSGVELTELEMFGTVHLYLYLTSTSCVRGKMKNCKMKKRHECLFLLPTAAARVAKHLGG